jgi:cyanophycinase-like exopeptidase
VTGRPPADGRRGSPLFLIAGGIEPDSRRGTEAIVQAALLWTGIYRPSVAYVGVASGDDPALRRRYIASLRRAGAGLVLWVPLCGRLANAPKSALAIDSADVVFFCGGDVEAGMRIVEERGLIPFLRSVHRSGIPFIGVSAGSIMLCRSWIRWADSRDEGSAELFPCLGLSRLICDTHGEGDGWGELKSVLALRPLGATGYGIESGSALIVEPDGTVTAFGGVVQMFKKGKAGVVQVRSLLPGPRRMN